MFWNQHFSWLHMLNDVKCEWHHHLSWLKTMNIPVAKRIFPSASGQIGRHQAPMQGIGESQALCAPEQGGGLGCYTTCVPTNFCWNMLEHVFFPLCNMLVGKPQPVSPECENSPSFNGWEIVTHSGYLIFPMCLFWVDYSCSSGILEEPNMEFPYGVLVLGLEICFIIWNFSTKPMVHWNSLIPLKKCKVPLSWSIHQVSHDLFRCFHSSESCTNDY